MMKTTIKATNLNLTPELRKAIDRLVGMFLNERRGDCKPLCMKIRESKNLKYDKITRISLDGEDYDGLDFQPRVCVLKSAERLDDTLTLHFKNRTQAVIRARNIEGGREIDLIEKMIPTLVGRSYEAILDTEI